MKAFLVGLTLAASSTVALAGSPRFVGDVMVFDDTIAHPRTRAEVRGEAIAAHARGELPLGEVTKFNEQAASGKSRAQVRSETSEALATRHPRFGEIAYPSFN